MYFHTQYLFPANYLHSNLIPVEIVCRSILNKTDPSFTYYPDAKPLTDSEIDTLVRTLTGEDIIPSDNDPKNNF